MAKFRKKPAVVEAVQWDGASISELQAFAGNDLSWSPLTGAAFIPTLEGLMRADKGDWIIKGVKGEFYPCKPDIFAATYEPIEGSKP